MTVVLLIIVMRECVSNLVASLLYRVCRHVACRRTITSSCRPTESHSPHNITALSRYLSNCEFVLESDPGDEPPPTPTLVGFAKQSLKLDGLLKTKICWTRCGKFKEKQRPHNNNDPWVCIYQPISSSLVITSTYIKSADENSSFTYVK